MQLGMTMPDVNVKGYPPHVVENTPKKPNLKDVWAGWRVLDTSKDLTEEQNIEDYSRALRKISTYGLMTGVRGRGAADRSILELSSRLSEVAPVFLGGGFDRRTCTTETHDAPVHLVAVAIFSRQTKRRML
jgi:hypothetical protein